MELPRETATPKPTPSTRRSVPSWGEDVDSTAHIRGIEAPEEPQKVETRHRQIIGSCDSQHLDCFGRLTVIQCEERAQGRDVTESDHRILGESLFEIVRERLRARPIARE